MTTMCRLNPMRRWLCGCTIQGRIETAITVVTGTLSPVCRHGEGVQISSGATLGNAAVDHNITTSGNDFIPRGRTPWTLRILCTSFSRRRTGLCREAISLQISSPRLHRECARVSTSEGLETPAMSRDCTPMLELEDVAVRATETRRGSRLAVLSKSFF